jgi:hypothetical protein
MAALALPAREGGAMTTYQRCLWFVYGALAATMALVVGPGLVAHP